MANTHSTLASLFTDIAKAIRSKTGSSASIVADQFPDAIAAIDTQENLDAELSTQDSLIAQIAAAVEGKAGVVLPTLSNPAGAGNIEAGYQAIDGTGKLIEGNMSGAVTVTATFNDSTGKSITVNGLSKYKNFMMVAVPNSSHSMGSYAVYGVWRIDGVINGNYYSSSKLHALGSGGVSVDGDVLNIGVGGSLMFNANDSLKFVLWN